MYAIIQSNFCNPHNPKQSKPYFHIIKGERASGGYPKGIEGIDWHMTKYNRLTIEQARKILSELNK